MSNVNVDSIRDPLEIVRVLAWLREGLENSNSGAEELVTRLARSASVVIAQIDGEAK